MNEKMEELLAKKRYMKCCEDGKEIKKANNMDGKEAQPKLLS